MWFSVFVISIGAAIGANIRWLLGLWLNALFPSLPPGTLAANWLGGWLIGIVLGLLVWLPQLAPEWRLFLVTGMLGGLTTFSSFSAEIFTNLQAGRWGLAGLGIVAHVGGSLLLTGLGVVTFAVVRSLLAK